LELLTAPF